MKKSIIFFVLFILTCKALLSVPAYPHPVAFTQPNGETVTVLIKGDERIHWHESMDGYTLLFNQAGYLSYAQLDGKGNLQPSDFVATNVDDRGAAVKSHLNTIDKKLFYSDLQKQLMLQVWEIEDEYGSRAEKVVAGQYKTLCAFVQFPEKAMTLPMSDFEGLMNQLGYTANGAVGSVRDFFKEASYNQFDLIVTLCGVYTAPNSEAYYAGSSGTAKCNELAEWIAQQVAAEPSINFADYDSNNDGVVDGFHFIFAGKGQEAGGGAGTIWSHKWSFSPSVTKNGKSISTYSCSPELYGSNITTIGVIVHEMTHAFGAPDFYDTDYGDSGGDYNGTGKWDVMAGGSWNGSPGGNCPPHHNMYTKTQFGWVTPVVLNSAATINNMPNSAQNPVAYKINTTTTNEYYLLENRQKVGFDASVPGTGLIIYHVHSNVGSSCINCTHPQRLYPVCASRTNTMPTAGVSNYGTINSDGCPFPGTSNQTSFTDDTTPAMLSWAGAPTNMPITNITNSGGMIGLDFMGGAPSEEPTTGITGDIFVGGLAGFSNESVIDSCYVIGNVTGNDDWVGGLVGYADGTIITNCYVIGDVVGASRVGGLVGNLYYTSTIENCYVIGDVTGSDDEIGGLVGYIYDSAITNSYTTSNVIGVSSVGGLVGNSYGNSSIANCYAAGDVVGYGYVGGLIGENEDSSITNSYATGDVTADAYSAGGLAGSNLASATITNCYVFNCKVELTTGMGDVGRIVGDNSGTLTNNYAFDQMSLWVNGAKLLTLTPSPADDNIHGEDLSYTDAMDPATYATWLGTAWTMNYTGYNAPDANLPILTVFTIVDFPDAEQTPQVEECCVGPFEVTVTPTEGGTASGNDPAVPCGVEIELTATAVTCYHFVRWTIDDVEVSIDNPYNFIVMEDVDLVAVFEETTYDITVAAVPPGGGTVTMNGITIDGEVGVGEFNIECGEEVVVTATSNDCTIIFLHWKDENDNWISDSHTYSFFAEEDRTVVAHFQVIIHNITLSAFPPEGGEVSGGGTNMDCGEFITVVASPNGCYDFVEWKEDGDNVSDDPEYTFMVNNPRILVAYFELKTYTVTPSAGAGGTISPNTTQTVDCGDDVAFTATPSTCYEVDEWFVNGDPVQTGGNDYTLVNIQENTTVHVTFKTIVYTVTPSAGTGGTISPNTVQNVNCGSSITLTATPNSNCQTIYQWIVNGTPVVTGGSSYTLSNVQANTTVEVTFTTATYTVTPSAGIGGTISPNVAQTVDCGTNIEFTATPDNCQVVDVWTVNESPVQTGGLTYTLQNVQASATIHVTFKVATAFPVMASPGPGGSISPNGTQFVACGGNIEFTAIPNTCQVVDVWTVNGSPVQTGGLTFLLQNVQAGATVQVTFKAITYSLTASAISGGTVSPSGTQTVNCGSNQLFTATPSASCIEVYQWIVNGDIMQTGGLTYTVPNIQANTQVQVSFKTIDYTITASVSSGGYISPSGSQFFSCGSNQTFMFATEGSCYEIEQVLIDGVNNPLAMENGFYTFENILTNHTIHVIFAVELYNIELSAEPTGSGTVIGGGIKPCGQLIEVEAIADECYTFDRWTEDGITVCNTPLYSFPVMDNRVLVAHFDPKFFDVTVSANPEEGGEVFILGENNDIPCGESVTVEAIVDDCYTFVNWTENGVPVSTTPTYTFNIMATRDLVANFLLNTHNITLFASLNTYGTVSGGGTKFCGEEITVTATPNPGFAFLYWTELNGDVVSEENEYTFIVEDTRVLIAHFEMVLYMIIATPQPSGSGTTTGSGGYFYGVQATVSATPASSCFIFINWTENGVPVSTANPYTFTVNSDRILEANFEQISYTVTASANPPFGGVIAVDPAAYQLIFPNGTSVPCGETITLEAIALPGFEFVNWTEGTGVASTTPSYTFTVNGPRTLVANFQPTNYNIILLADLPTSGQVFGAGSYPYGTPLQVSAVANPGYQFVNWTDEDNVEVFDLAYYSFMVTGHRTLIAHFEPKELEIITLPNPNLPGFTLTGGGGYDYGDPVTVAVAATPAGYAFVNWTKNGVEVSPVPTYTFQATESCTLVANFAFEDYHNIILSANPVGSGNVYGGGLYSYGETAVVWTTPNPGYQFVNWTEGLGGPVVATTLLFTFTVTGDRNLVANYVADTYQIVVIPNPNPDGGTVTGGGNYLPQAVAIVTATAATGYRFDRWTENGATVSQTTTYLFIVTGHRTLIANFVPEDYCDIVLLRNPDIGGTVEGAGIYATNETITVKAFPNPGWIFVNWTENGAPVATTAFYTFPVTGSRVLTANFIQDGYNITLYANPPEAGEVEGEGSYEYGDNITVSASANPTWEFVNWTENNLPVSTNANYPFTVTGSRILVANFAHETCNIVVTAQPPQGGQAFGGDTNIPYGVQKLVYAIPTDDTWEFVNWTEDDEEVSTQAFYIFTVEGSRNLVAHFARETRQITLLAEPPQGGDVEGGGPHPFEGEITITAIPNTGYDFVNWTDEEDEEVTTNADYTFIVLEDRTFTANFAIQYYDIVLIANPEEYGEVEGEGNYFYGETITVDAIPNDTYVFVNWTEDGEEVSTDASYTFEVEGPRTLTANFAFSAYEVVLIANPLNGGELFGDGTYSYGAPATVVALANSDYVFVKWTKDGEEVSDFFMYNFTVTEDVELVAHFELKNAIETINTGTVMVYPNPTSGEITIENGELKIESVEILDILGRKQKIIFNFQLSTFNSIDISDMPPGTYFLRIQTDTGVVTRTVIKY